MDRRSFFKQAATPIVAAAIMPKIWASREALASDPLSPQGKIDGLFAAAPDYLVAIEDLSRGCLAVRVSTLFENQEYGLETVLGHRECITNPRRAYYVGEATELLRGLVSDSLVARGAPKLDRALVMTRVSQGQYTRWELKPGRVPAI